MNCVDLTNVTIPLNTIEGVNKLSHTHTQFHTSVSEHRMIVFHSDTQPDLWPVHFCKSFGRCLCVHFFVFRSFFRAFCASVAWAWLKSVLAIWLAAWLLFGGRWWSGRGSGRGLVTMKGKMKCRAWGAEVMNFDLMLFWGEGPVW